MCHWIVDELGPDVPLHFSAFHPDFQLTDRGPTPPETLAAAYDIARRAGLRYVYTGNISDRRRQATYCPGCGQAVIERDGYCWASIAFASGRCAQCRRADRRPVRRRAGRLGRPPPAGPHRPTSLPTAAGRRRGRPPAVCARRSSDEQQERVFRAAGQRVAAAVRASALPGRCTAILGEIGRHARLRQLRQPEAGRPAPRLLRLSRARRCRWARRWTSAAVRAAKDDPRFPPIAAAELDSLDMEVWLLWGLQPVAARGRDRAPGRHHRQARRADRPRPRRAGCCLPCVAVDHHLDAKGLLQQVCLKAGLPADAWLHDDTTLMTFEGYAIAAGPRASGAADRRIAAARWPMPRGRPPWPAPSIRPARGNRPDARRVLRRAARRSRRKPGRPPWCRTPAGSIRAGWRRPCSAACRYPRAVIVFCPRHHFGGAEWAVAPLRRWLIPGGEVPADRSWPGNWPMRSTGLQLDAAAAPPGTCHRGAVAAAGPAGAAGAAWSASPSAAAIWPSCAVFAAQLAGVLARSCAERPLLLISSDMNHFADEARTRRLDRLALDALESLDPARLYETVRQHHISMCGVRAGGDRHGNLAATRPAAPL